MPTAGTLRTRIIIEAPESKKTGKGSKKDNWVNVFGEGVTIAAEWKRKMTRFDSTVDNTADDRQFASDTAKVKIRRCAGVTSVCRIKRVGDDEGYWYIDGSPEVNGGWIELTASRRAASV